ncbi:MAG: aldose 1-epimerase [Actinomycetales bacterium]|nr:aldose 1-epimerase [Actinomycetales bacterium]
MTHGIRREPDAEDPSFERVTLGSDDGVEVAFVPGAGMVGVSMTLDGVELLARRHGLAGYLGRGSTFGIPLLAPWANRLASPHQVVGDVAWDVRVGDPGVHADEFGQPIHGLSAGAREWEVEDVGADRGGARLRARLRVDARLVRFVAFPFAHDLVVDVTLSGRTLRVSTALTATGGRAVPIAFGWHPWFEFPDVPRAEWELDVPFVRRAVLDDVKIPTGEVVDEPAPRGPLGTTVLDDVFVDVPPGAVASVRAGGRGVAVTYVAGYDVGVVFAPSEADVVCVEPMTAPTDPFSGRFPLRLAQPGETVEAVFEVTAERH